MEKERKYGKGKKVCKEVALCARVCFNMNKSTFKFVKNCGMIKNSLQGYFFFQNSP